MQDNNLKHTSLHGKEFLDRNNVNWWKTDMNPIENLWHELKEFIHREVKPRTKDELVDGISKFWETI